MVEDHHLAAHNPPGPARKAPGRAAAFISRTLDAARDAIYPDLCPVCRGRTATRHGLCPDCWPEVDFIAGPTCGQCGAPVAGGAIEAGEALTCDGCLHAPPAWSRGAAAVVYAGVGRRLALALKHGDRLDIAPVAAGWMLRAGGPLVRNADLIAPAPLHWRRLLRRRFNQSGELARELAAQAGRPEALALDLLTRVRATPSQDGRTRSGRVENVAGAFRLSPAAARKVAGRRVLLIDDVLTTGATLSACAATCLDAGAAEVTALVFARVSREDWPTS